MKILKNREKHIFFMFLATLFMHSCKTTEDCCTPPPNNNYINFSNLQIGQKSIYVRSESMSWRNDSDTTFKKMTDTLHLKIIEKDANGFKVEEFHFNKKRPTVYFYFNVAGDSLIIKAVPSTSSAGSSMFINDSQTFTLKEQGLTKWTANRWVIPQNIPFGKSFGYVENATINGINYAKALGSYDSNQTIFDGPFRIKLYSKEAGFLSVQNLGSLAPGAEIWNLLP
jgi:hypothetical protein